MVGMNEACCSTLPENLTVSDVCFNDGCVIGRPYSARCPPLVYRAKRVRTSPGVGFRGLPAGPGEYFIEAGQGLR